jgi:tRNA-dihydrouridine synthase
MGTPQLAAAVVSATVDALAPYAVPVTVKFRSGVVTGEVTAVDFARRMEATGAAGLCIHGRFARQLYHGQADWSVIAAVKAAVAVPVTGSGDVMTAADVVRMGDTTGVDGVMIARGARGNPWIFAEAREALIGAVSPAIEGRFCHPAIEKRLQVMRDHARRVVDWYGEDNLTRFRGHAIAYVRGLPGAAEFRRRLHELSTVGELDVLVREYLRGYKSCVGGIVRRTCTLAEPT